LSQLLDTLETRHGNAYLNGTREFLLWVCLEGRIFDENGYDPEGLDRQEI